MHAPTFSPLSRPAAPLAATVRARACAIAAMTAMTAMMKKSIKTGMKVASATIIAV